MLLALDPTPFISMLVSSSFADDAATARKSLGENGSASAKTWTGRTIGPPLLPHNCLLCDASHTRNFPAQLSLFELTVFSLGEVGSRVRLAAYGSGNGAPQDGWTELNRPNYYCTELASEDYPCILNNMHCA